MGRTGSELSDSMSAGQSVGSTWGPESRNRREEFEQAKLDLLQVLRMRGIAKLIVRYDGYADEGGVGLLACEPASATLRLLGAAPLEMNRRCRDAGSDRGAYSVLDAAYDLTAMALEIQFAGWETDNGSAGAFIIDVVEGTFTLQHSYRVTHDCPHQAV